MHKSSTAGSLSLPAAIIVAAAIIAVALIWINKPSDKTAATNSPSSAYATQGESGIPPVTSADHILGNPNAPIKFVEYSDLSCPYCKSFNPAISGVIDEYGPTGKVAWVYRHFPLMVPGQNGAIVHPNSESQAIALECVAKLGGNSAFFAFERKWFVSFPDTGATRSAAADRAEIDKTAKIVGVDPISFNDCMASGRYKDAIAKAFQAGIDAGVTGTPTTIVFTPSGNAIPLIGIQSYATLKNTVETLIPTIASTTSIKN